MKRWDDSPNFRPELAIFALVVGSILFKLVFFVVGANSIYHGDEMLYREYSQGLFDNFHYRGAMYPMGYPLLIAPAFWWGDDFYEVMLIINAVVSSTSIWFAYLIARLYLPKLESLGIAVLAFAMPYHFDSPRFIMSENLFVPMLFLAVFLALRRTDENRAAWDILTGIVIAAMVLTRHIGVVIVPALALTWLISNWKTGGRLWLRVALIGVVTAICLTPWVWMKVREGVPLPHIFGGVISAVPLPEQRTLQRLIDWTIFYLSYLALIAAPALPFIIAGIHRVSKNRTWRALYEHRLTVFVVLLTPFLLFIITRHSFNTRYNFPEYGRTMGRYVLFMPFLYALAAIVESRIPSELSRAHRAILALVAVVVGLLGYLVLFQGAWVNLRSDFVSRYTSLDGYIIGRAGWFWIIGLAAFAALTAWLSLRAPRAILWAFTGALAVFWLAASYANRDAYESYNAAAIPARVIAEVIEGPVTFYHGGGVNGRQLQYGLRFYGYRSQYLRIGADDKPEHSRIFVIANENEVYGDYVLKTYQVKGVTYQVREVLSR